MIVSSDYFLYVTSDYTLLAPKIELNQFEVYCYVLSEAFFIFKSQRNIYLKVYIIKKKGEKLYFAYLWFIRKTLCLHMV